MTLRRELNVLIGCGCGENGGENSGDSYGDDVSLQGHLLCRDWGIGSWELRTGVVEVATEASRRADRNLWHTRWMRQERRFVKAKMP
ncbi:MAG: hypothetical protein AW07_02852 [Candidatus Accumulibacter sp. SK-11]|nr:MAG: hypothetical protein AW07_02852 [Candidatus Accumulibacter sp. SK-11]